MRICPPALRIEVCAPSLLPLMAMASAPGDQLLQIQIGDDSDVRGGADSRRGGLIRLACRDWIGQRHGDSFAFDHRGTIDHFVLDKRIAFHAAGYFLGLFVNLGAW